MMNRFRPYPLLILSLLAIVSGWPLGFPPLRRAAAARPLAYRATVPTWNPHPEALTTTETPSAATAASTPDSAKRTRRVEAYGQLPLSFEPNKGQTRSPVKFLSHAPGYTLFLTSTEAVLSWSNTGPAARAAGPDRAVRSSTGVTSLTMKLVGAHPQPPIFGQEELPGKSHYFIGHDPQKWRTNISNYKRVRYQNVYPGIDLIYHGNQQQLEYDFVISPGGHPSTIRLRFDGAQSLRVNAEGDLILRVDGQEIRQPKPSIYQERAGRKEPIAGAYALRSKGQYVTFSLGAYDARRPLIIDPVLVYSTYLGGSKDNESHGIAVDSRGNAYITGYTTSNDFPRTATAFQRQYGGNQDAFVRKVSASGSEILYSTYLGGDARDEGLAVAIDASGNAYVTGHTSSTNFPTTPNAFQPIYGGGASDAFIAQLNATGSDLIFSTYFGGGCTDAGTSIAVHPPSGSAFITGYTCSDTWIASDGAFQPARRGQENAFVAKFTAQGARAYSTYLGGDVWSAGRGIAVDDTGNAYITGHTNSPNFPVRNPIQLFSGDDDVFVAKLNPDGTDLVYSTYLGGRRDDQGRAIAVDAAGNAYVTGYTGSVDFPTTAGALQPDLAGDPVFDVDAFVAKLNPNGSALVYSTFLGGSGRDEGRGLAVDRVTGIAYVTGYTRSSDDFPQINPWQGRFGGGSSDAFVAQLHATGTTLIYSTYLGGSGHDEGHGIAVDATGAVYVTGMTSSPDFPATTWPFPVPSLHLDGFVVKMSDAPGSYSISGRITNESGAGIGRVTVHLSGFRAERTETGTDGRYYFINLPAGQDYTVSPQSTRYLFTPPRTSFTSLTRHATADFTARPSFRIRGRVLGAGGDGLVGVTMTLQEGTQSRSVLTDPNGNYAFDSLPAGGRFTLTPSRARYAFTPQQAEFLDLQDDQVVDFTGVHAGYRISGRVTDTQGAGVADMPMMISGSTTQFIQTNEGGYYTFANLTPGGHYTITLSRTYYIFNPLFRSFTNLRDDQTGVNFTTIMAGTVAQITRMAPAAGLVGSAVSLGGANFGPTQGTSTVQFNDRPAVPSRWSPLAIETAVPTGATSGPVMVTVGGFASNGVPFRVGAFPIIGPLSSTSGPRGSAVVISGAHFGATPSTSTLQFNGVPAPATTWNDSRITTVVPQGATTGPIVVSVAGRASNGPTFTVTSGQKSALLVVGDEPLESAEQRADQAIQRRLETMDYSVTVRSGSVVTREEALDKTVVVISATAAPGAVQTKFRAVAIPVVNSQPGLFYALGMTGDGAEVDYGTYPNQTQVNILATQPPHPLAAGFSGIQTVTVADTWNPFTWGRPNAYASTIATHIEAADLAIIFGYDRGASMPGLTAPARRVGLFVGSTTATQLNAIGWKLFEAAVHWAADTRYTLDDPGGAVDLTVFTPLR